MGIKIKIAAMAISIFVIGGCSNANSQPDEEVDHSMMNMGGGMMENGHMSYNPEI